MGEQKTTASSVNRAKTYQLVLFPLNNGATNVYYVLVLSLHRDLRRKVLALSLKNFVTEDHGQYPRKMCI